ncbi:glycosyltransferase family 4 protein [Mesorhizobium sp. RP14(2022)]|uniref:Glycosyltransferase family 4 protein n=1 Tax=Mesorhizobium liriopis TaxID=2953882 RepID=A0ABT1C2T4_9HYPH|nr:glycosyltransferase family 4 protein [Mesorhizobium liriopis]
MRILVYPHDLGIGGSQINAIDLAASVAARGHEVMVYGVPGPLNSHIEKRGLRFIPAHPLKYRPAPTRIMELARIAGREKLDLIHAYEWPPCLDAYYGASLLMGVPLLCTVLSMSVMPAVPASVPLIMGTEELGRKARKRQTAPVWVLEPPIDVVEDHPGIDGSAFRQAHGVDDVDLLVVSVSRLALDLKLDALVRAVDAADMLAGRFPLKLVLVGDGPAREAIEMRVRAVNGRHGREVIVFHGAALDPRTAYAAADLVVGMGSSALRAMAIGKPVIVQGETAFSEVFEPATLETFLFQGFYGNADSEPGTARLARQMERLLSCASLRETLGSFGRKTVEERFSLERAAEIQLGIYHRVSVERPSRNISDAASSALHALQIQLDYYRPGRKRGQKAQTESLLRAACAGLWPPPRPV